VDLADADTLSSPHADNNDHAAADGSLCGDVALLEATPADNNAGAALADGDAIHSDVALLEAPPAHNNAGAALADPPLGSVGLKATDDADGAVEDASLASDVEFDWRSVSV
jgi:hypothetical protein